jgi:hypothetical protein
LLELAIWDSVKESSNAEMYSAYLELYADGAFASLAKVRLEGLASTSLGARGNDAFVQVSGCQHILYIENTIYQNVSIALATCRSPMSLSALAAEGRRLARSGGARKKLTAIASKPRMAPVTG